MELYPAGFPADHRWYYMACTEVEGLEEPFPSGMLSRYIPACQYVKFTVRGPVTEIAPAFQYIYKDWLPKSGVKIAGTYDLELYDSRFVDPCSEDSLVDILQYPANKSDAVHPNSTGYRQMAEDIQGLLEDNGAL